MRFSTFALGVGFGIVAGVVFANYVKRAAMPETKVLHDSTLIELANWFRATDPYRHNSVDAYDVLVHRLEFRRRLGPMIAKVTPHTSTCSSCGLPWTLVDGHTVSYSGSSGMFPVCEQCWRDLLSLGRTDEIIGYHIALRDSWEREARASGHDHSYLPSHESLKASVIAALRGGVTAVH